MFGFFWLKRKKKKRKKENLAYYLCIPMYPLFLEWEKLSGIAIFVLFFVSDNVIQRKIIAESGFLSMAPYRLHKKNLNLSKLTLVLISSLMSCLSFLNCYCRAFYQDV